MVELLTGIVIGFAGIEGCKKLYENYKLRSYRKATSKRMSHLAGIEKEKKKQTKEVPKQQQQKQADPKPFWWQTTEGSLQVSEWNKKRKHPETKEEMDKLQKKNWSEFKNEVGEVPLTLSPSAKMQYKDD